MNDWLNAHSRWSLFGRYGDARRLGLWIAVGAALLAGTALGDEIELVNGRKYRGLLIERTDSSVVFKAVLGSGAAELTFPASRVKSVKVDGKMPPIPKTASRPAPGPRVTPPAPTTRPAVGPVPPKPKTQTGAQITALINQAGTTPPDWWDSVALNYPKTLDLAGTNPTKGWAPQRNLGAYMRSVITTNPRRWKEGAKLLHHVVKVREGSPPKQGEATWMLARHYGQYLNDWARAAYFYRQVMPKSSRLSQRDVVGLSRCYWKLGSKPMAVQVLSKYRLNRTPSRDAIQLYAQMGDLKQALSLAETMARAGAPGMGYVAAGDACRQAGQLPQALAYYEKTLAAERGTRRLAFYQSIARLAVESIKVFQSMDLSAVRDGTYTASAKGYRGPIEVKVIVKGGRIASVTVTRHREDLFYTAMIDIPKGILDGQGLKGVAVVTGATVSSEAIMNAAAKALAGAAK